MVLISSRYQSYNLRVLLSQAIFKNFPKCKNLLKHTMCLIGQIRLFPNLICCFFSFTLSLFQGGHKKVICWLKGKFERLSRQILAKKKNKQTTALDFPFGASIAKRLELRYLDLDHLLTFTHFYSKIF